MKYFKKGADPLSRVNREEDYFDEDACDLIDDDKDRCYEDCVLRNLRKKTRPPYGIGWLGRDCQEYSKDMYVGCKALCKMKG